MDSRGGLICPLCPREHTCCLRLSLREYLQHIKLFHAHQPNFHISCGIGGCERTFTNGRTFEHHISSYHRGELHPTNDISGCNDDLRVNGGRDENESGNSEGLGDGNLPVIHIPESSTLQRSSALFLLHTKECHKLTQTALQGVIEGVTGLCQGRLSAMHSAVNKVLTNSGISPSSISELDDVFDPEGEFGRPFLGLETQHQQVKFYKTHFRFVEPVRVVLGERRVWTGSGVQRRSVVQEQTMMYVPILQTLQVLLLNEAIVAEIENGHKSQTELLHDFCDGKVFSSHPLFSVHKDALQIFFYFDELEVCNPLGSKAKIHKLGIFYFTLGNLSPKFRSKLSAIQLIAIVEAPVMTSYGMDAVLRPFVDDVKKLEAGYEFEVNSASKVLYGTVAAVAADNLGSLALGGFKESCSAQRCCRQCLTTRVDAKKMFLEHQFTLRNKETHTEHLAELEGEEGSAASTRYGINRDSILNELEYFHVCSGGLLPDIMHDLLEGALQYEIKLMLKVFILEEKYITLSELNSRLEFFELGYMESKDRPSPISEANIRAHSGSSKNTLKQTAAQMWLFSRILPVMIGDKIPEDDEYWVSFLRVLEIVDRLFTPNLEEDDAAYLQALIGDHHQEFCHIYPDESVIPKMHFMVHMPRLMIQYGPLVRHWTMRYEAKHSYFKRLAQSMGNFINVPYSLAMRHQFLQCYDSTDDAEILGAGLTVGPGSVVSSVALEDDEESSAFEAKWIKADGFMYKKGAGVIHTVNRMPQVAMITAIYVIRGVRVVFRVRLFTTDCYAPHIHAYVVKPSFTYSLINIDNLVLPNPIHIRNVRRQTLFVLPYHVKLED